MGLLQRLQGLKEAYISGKSEAKLEDTLLPLANYLSGPGRDAFFENYQKSREASIGILIPEKGLERYVHDLRLNIGRIGILWRGYKNKTSNRQVGNDNS